MYKLLNLVNVSEDFMFSSKAFHCIKTVPALKELKYL